MSIEKYFVVEPPVIGRNTEELYKGESFFSLVSSYYNLLLDFALFSIALQRFQ